MPVQSQNVLVMDTISLTCIKEKKFVKFVMLDVTIVLVFSITVSTVKPVLEEIMLHIVIVHQDI